MDADWLAAADIGGLLERTNQLPAQDQPWLTLDRVFKYAPEEQMAFNAFTAKKFALQEPAPPDTELGKILLELKRTNQKLTIIQIAGWIYVVLAAIGIILFFIVMANKGQSQMNFRFPN